MADTFRAAVLEEVGKPINLKTLPMPEAVHGSAVIKVLAVGLSPNTKDVFEGTFAFGLKTPVIPSAACIGRVHKVGPDATSLKQGLLVFTDFWTQSRDNPDDSILTGCMGGHAPLEKTWEYGTFAEYARVPLERVWAVDESLLERYTPSDLVYLGNLCISLAGLMAIEVHAGDSVIVAPATGTYGGAAVHAAVALGARVIACGRNEQSLAKITALFPSNRVKTIKLSGNAEEDTAAIKAAAGGKGADKYVDFSPSGAQGLTHPVSCLSALRRHGRAVLMGGVFGTIEIPYIIVMANNLHIEGRYMYDRIHGEQALKLVETGQLPLGETAAGQEIQSFGLDDLEKAVEAAAKDRGWGEMTVLEPWKS